MVTRLFECTSPESDTFAFVSEEVEVTADIKWTQKIVETSDDGFYYKFMDDPVTELDAVMRPFINDHNHAVDCVAGTSVIGAFANQAVADALRYRFKAAWIQHCYQLSPGVPCLSPNPDRAIVDVLDPVLTVGSVAAANLEAQFPCGVGPIGTTVCGTTGAFAPGDYVFVLATFGAEIPTADATGLYQHAFVFDADGNTSNNYVPPPQYPADFFLGTDKWYQLFYTPDDGFSIKVVDARISTSNAVASNARMIVAGRELAAFIPRAELDGTAPGFRVTTFRHEGDYGLQGGPWDASYYPPLDEPLMPAAAGEAIVLPEN
jgi:hypothetical protein